MDRQPTPLSDRSAPSLARAIYHAALDAVRADTLVRTAVRREGDLLRIANLDEPLDLSSFGKTWVVGAGKAAAPMAQAIEEILGDRLTAGLVVTKDGHALPTRTVGVLEAAHPVPDERSVEAGRRIVEIANGAQAGDLVICLLSGGASALLELPEDSISLDDLQATTAALLRSGAPIQELNVVRACLSKVKAGGLARAAAPATLLCLVVSDVLGNPLELIGSGPCVPTAPERSRALDILRSRGLLDQVPVSVRSLLDQASEEKRCDGAGPGPAHVILGDIWTALNAARDAAVGLGLRPMVLTGWLEGEAREVGKVFGGLARDLPGAARETGIDCYLAGGETTVTVRGTGKGGRSQELAAAAALRIEGVRGVALLAAGTDGTDGPTDAAGAVVDGATSVAARSAGCDLGAALRDNDCYPALAAARALVHTGPTLSNVGDLVVITSTQ